MVQQGVTQFIILVGELNGGLIEHDTLFHAVVLGEGTGGDVADNHFQGHDGNFLHDGLPLVDFLDVVGGNTLLLQVGHQTVGHLIVDDALALDGALLQAVEGGGIVLVLHNQLLGIVGSEDLLGLAFIQLLQLLHGS